MRRCKSSPPSKRNGTGDEVDQPTGIIHSPYTRINTTSPPSLRETCALARAQTCEEGVFADQSAQSAISPDGRRQRAQTCRQSTVKAEKGFLGVVDVDRGPAEGGSDLDSGQGVSCRRAVVCEPRVSLTSSGEPDIDSDTDTDTDTEG